MRRWGILISLLYALIVIGLLVPAGMVLVEDNGFLTAAFFKEWGDIYGEWMLWVPLVMLLCGQAALLFLSTGASQKRLKPRAPVVLSCIAGSMLFLLLTLAAVLDVGVAVYSDKFGDKLPDNMPWLFGSVALLWAAWAVVFYRFGRTPSGMTMRAVSWLLKGSVLEFLIAVPCHVIVRRRHDCCAPIATSFGITTGIAIMLAAFGPSVLLLYKKRLDAYRGAGQASGEPHATVPG